MTNMTAQAAHSARDFAPVAQTGGSFANYVSMLREVFSEALQQTSEARRKYPFADV